MDFAFFLRWLLAFSPIAVVLILMVGLRWGGGKAGAAGWFTALIVSVVFFGANPTLLAYSQAKGVLLSLHVLFIVWMALLLYNVVNETPAIALIGAGIKKITQDRPIQLLILGWVFAAFLQGVAGFGVPIAVVAPLLVGLGFSPVVSVAVPAIGHSWAVTFGDMASSFQALIAVTGLSGQYLAHWSSVFLGVSVFLCGAGVALVYGGIKSLAHSTLAIVIIGLVMAVSQYILAVWGLWTLAGFVAAILGMFACFVVARLPMYQKQADPAAEAMAPGAEGPSMGLGMALLPYIILIVIVTFAELYAPLHRWLNIHKLSLYFPEVQTGLGWVVKAGYGKKISLFGHAGSLLTYSALISFVIYQMKGFYPSKVTGDIIAKTVKSGVPTSLGVVSMVCFSLIMDNSGMTHLLAKGVSSLFGGLYPLFASAIGTLGAFMTGSNTNSNVVFGALQMRTAELAGLAVAVILGAQTTGGALGSMLAPAKIIVGCSTVGLSGKEGPVLRVTIKYGVAMTALIGFMTLLVVYWL